MIVGNYASGHELTVQSGLRIGGAAGHTGNHSAAAATVAGSPNYQLQLTGFSGSSSDHASRVEVAFGSTDIITRSGNAITTGSAVSEWFGELGPIAAHNEAITVTTNLIPYTTGNATAELFYRRVP